MAPDVVRVIPQEERSGPPPPNNVKPPATHQAPLTAAANTTTTDRNRYSLESERLKTFANWPVPFIEKRELASAGFVYKYRDVVQCIYCGVEIGEWEEGDEPIVEHERWAPLCPFIRNRTVNGSTTEQNAVPRTISYDTCGLYGTEIRPNSSPEPTPSCSSTESPPTLDKLGIHTNTGPVWPKYSTQEARLASFDGWPLAIKQRPDKLSEAGFFYTGKGDQTVCFHCGGGLKDWEEADDPWVEHALWFSKCLFVILVKGKDFVDNICQNKDAIITAKEATNIKLPPNLQEAVKVVNPEAASAASSEQHLPVLNTEREIDDPRICKICFQEEMGVLFLPCGHIVACVKCAPSLSSCAVCRKPVSATVRAFLS
ncbi:death-associated inhibitor of apoptosis 1-like [Schistocerca nitens]|uniref:death-associated inhibitor of apoptosis 1-like n=1 Tax=Schistocerca nitens TaxID=7011 RepID=UPI00211828C4|nr:death-associated inhibitor of apoptosis 1-like [Schistocerca nitens]